MMFLWKRRTLRRLTILGSLLVGVVVLVLLWPKGDGVYISGEELEGITDTLGRALPDDHPPVRFREVTKESGLLFRHFPYVRSGRLPEDMGSGVALGDADGDGWTDVFCANLAGTFDGLANNWDDKGAACAMFRNLGNGQFEDVTETSGLGLQALANGAAWVDVDSDGKLDLFVTTYGQCYLFHNEGKLHFKDVSAEAGLMDLHGFWTGIATGDYDRDGNMDIYVCGYVQYKDDPQQKQRKMDQYGAAIPALLNPSVFPPQANLLLHNLGGGKFEEVATQAGVDDPTGRGLGATFTDWNNDGWPDLYVANDVSDNTLFLNLGNGKFANQTAEALLGDYRGAMGMAVNDFDQDQDLDLFITHWMAQENALYQNVGASKASESSAAPKLLFMDKADRFGLGQIALDMVGWATGFFDFDNDGLRDLFVINGSTIPDKKDPSQLIPQRPQLFWNAGQERGFFELGAAAGDFFIKERVGRGGAHFDYDLDGDLDILVLSHGGTAHLLRNETEKAGGSLLLRLRQSSGNRFANGASVIVKWQGHAMMDQVGAQGSYLSQHAAGELVFGLGDASQLDTLVVRWPDGTTETAGPFPANRVVLWERNQAPVVQPYPGKLLAAVKKPESVEDQRRFFALVQDARRARINGDLSVAEAAYREALKLWPGHWDSLYYLGNLLMEQGREAEALKTFEDLAFYQPQGSRAWMQIGRLHLPGGDPDLDDLDAAREAFLVCRSINPEESEPSLQLGLVCLLEGDYSQADSYFSDAAMHNLRSIPARWFRGWLSYQKGEREQAQAFLQEAYAIATQKKAAGSTSNEGDTKEGARMMAQRKQQDPRSLLHRWQSLQQRSPDIDVEFQGLTPPL